MKIVETERDVGAFLATVEPDIRREDAHTLLSIMERASEAPPRMWGDSIVGFGAYAHRYKSGREGRWFLTGFSPRKAQMTIYIMPEIAPYADSISRLGPMKTSRACLYTTRLERVDLAALEDVIAASVRGMREEYGTAAT